MPIARGEVQKGAGAAGGPPEPGRATHNARGAPFVAVRPLA